MFERLSASLDGALGLELEAKHLSVGQMSARAVVVFLIATAMIRLGSKRFMGKSTALDVMLGIVFGSLISRAISGNAPFFPTLSASLTLVLLHWLISALAIRSHRFGALFKGHPQVLVEDGQIQWERMRKSHLTEHDLHEALRKKGKGPDLRQIRSAHLERNGEISFLFA